MKNKKRLRGEHRIILTALLKEGPLSLKDLTEKTFVFISQFESLGSAFFRSLHLDDLHRRRDKKHQEMFDASIECEQLIKDNMITLNEEGRYELLEKGREAALKSADEIEKAVNFAESKIFNPSAAAKNTIAVDLLLAVMKLVTGFISGSIGLIADGADSVADTASAIIVWIGLKTKKEFLGTLIIILMLFVTALSIGYESATKIIEAMSTTIPAISMPYLVVVIEGIALITALILYMYQRYVGKKYGSFVLISQSIDSRNHVYVAAAVILGAFFSILGISFIDVLIGAAIAVRFLIDGLSLSKEAFSSMRGEEIDFSKYQTGLEKNWHLSKLETFRNWILYVIMEENLKDKVELVNSLERTFGPKYVPILSEFKSSLGEGFNFEKEFDNLIDPLLEKKLIIIKDVNLILTEEGRKRVDWISKSMRYHQSN